jgi:hypothetical protein
VTGRASRRPRPGPGGTGRVADELYLIDHHEVTGRVHLSPRAAGLGLTEALLTELVLDGPGWGLILKLHRPQVYAAIGLGAHAITATPAPASQGPR